MKAFWRNFRENFLKKKKGNPEGQVCSRERRLETMLRMVSAQSSAACLPSGGQCQNSCILQGRWSPPRRFLCQALRLRRGWVGSSSSLCCCPCTSPSRAPSIFHPALPWPVFPPCLPLTLLCSGNDSLPLVRELTCSHSSCCQWGDSHCPLAPLFWSLLQRALQQVCDRYCLGSMLVSDAIWA